MKIVNKTQWETAPLRAIAQRAIAQVLSLTPGQRKRLVITFLPGKHDTGASGKCYIGALWDVRVFLPSAAKRMKFYESIHADPAEARQRGGLVNNRSVAMVIVHEIMHGLGYVHEDLAMKGAWFRDHYAQAYAWADDVPVLIQAPAIRPPRATDADKLAKAEAMVKKWESKIKRDTTHLKKWEKKVKYYRRKLK